MKIQLPSWNWKEWIILKLYKMLGFDAKKKLKFKHHKKI